MSIKNDRLVCRKSRQYCQNNISLVMESTNSTKNLQKEKINGIFINNGYMFNNRWKD
jgi:hypothetical protein